MTVFPGPYLDNASFPKLILPGMVVSCSNPVLTGGIVLANPVEDWDAASNDMIYVNWGGGNVIWVNAAFCTVTG
jgi:hypothetical protein